MTDPNHLCDLWEHTIDKVIKHDSKSQLGLMLKQWIIFNKLENFNSILNYIIDDFTPSYNLCYINQHGKILHHTPLREDFNLRCYIQHFMDESEDETQNPLSEENWMKQNNWKFIKYVIHHRHPMTPEQLKQNHSKKFSRINMKKLIQRKGSQMKRKRNPLQTSSDKTEQNSESDIAYEDEEETNTTETHQVHNVLNETIHEEENPSEAEDDTSEDENVTEMQTYGNNGKQNKQENNLLTTNFEVKVENRKVEGLITYSTDQQIFKLKVNSGTDQEVLGVYIDFQSIHSKWTIDAILQHMHFYVTTENPNVMMRENHNMQASEHIIICQDGLFIVSTTPDEILHVLKDKYKIKSISRINIHMILVEEVFVIIKSRNIWNIGGKDNYQIKEYLEHLYENMNILFNNKFPTDLHIAFKIFKLLIEKGNLTLIHNKNSYKHLHHLSRKRKLDKLYNEM